MFTYFIHTSTLCLRSPYQSMYLLTLAECRYVPAPFPYLIVKRLPVQRNNNKKKRNELFLYVRRGLKRYPRKRQHEQEEKSGLLGASSIRPGCTPDPDPLPGLWVVWLHVQLFLPLAELSGRFVRAHRHTHIPHPSPKRVGR